MISIFHLFYYMHPEAPFIAGENMATFAALKSFAWAMPPAHLMAPGFLTLIKILGNYLLPVLSLILAVMVLARPGKYVTEVGAERLGNMYLILGALPFLVAGSLIGFSTWIGTDVNMAAYLGDNLGQYAMHAEGKHFTGDYGEPSVFNIFHLGLAGSLAWSGAALWGCRWGWKRSHV